MKEYYQDLLYISKYVKSVMSEENTYIQIEHVRYVHSCRTEKLNGLRFFQYFLSFTKSTTFHHKNEYVRCSFFFIIFYSLLCTQKIHYVDKFLTIFLPLKSCIIFEEYGPVPNSYIHITGQ